MRGRTQCILGFAFLCSAAFLKADKLEDAMRLLWSGDASRGVAALKQLAGRGNVQAQLFLGHAYSHSNPVIKDPDYAEALKWFSRASLKGSGEASAAVAGMYEDGAGVSKSARKAAEWWGLAVKQGWDQQELEVRCLILKPGTNSLACEPQTGGVGCPAETEMKMLREAGLTGILQPYGGASVRQRAGPKARAMVVLDHPIFGEVELRQPRHTSVIYVQRKSGWQLLPADAPLLNRPIVLQPQSDAPRHTLAYVKDVDGSSTGGSCAAWE
jgi:hypothetical protein